jgi:hypothetical protein
VWPADASQALIANDGGFGVAGGAKTLQLAAQVPWVLPRTGADRLPKTVYVRYLGAGLDLNTFTDDIILDETAPTLQSVSLVGTPATPAMVSHATTRRRPRLHGYRVRVRGKAAIAGICAVGASSRRSGGQVTTIANCHHKGIVARSRVVVVRSTNRPRYLRVRNSAGTWSRWQRLHY